MSDKRTKITLVGKIILLWSLVAVMTAILYMQMEKNRTDYRGLLKQDLLHEAIAHFDNMVVARSWNASHGGVYVKAHEGIRPNPYLRDNVLKSEDNETLIKVNPAWMTRQLSEISNEQGRYFYKITSLDPLNPENRADSFETEALRYFEDHKEEKYYSHFGKSDELTETFDFMGSLTVTKNCLPCHAQQGYVVGDVRGGIRVSIPLDDYSKSLMFMEKKSDRNRWMLLGLSSIIALLLTLYLLREEKHHEEIVRLNDGLEKKVLERTQALNKMNSTLESRVADGVEENRRKDEAMMVQSRYAAMGEMIGALAHQWRQPIAVIEMGVNNILVDLELEIEDKDEMRKQLNGISEETQALAKIITDFSTMFKATSTKSLVHPGDIVDEALSIMQGSLDHHKITVIREFAAESALMLMSRELFQVYLNLLNNAKEILVERAIPEPRITISIEEKAGEVLTHICDNAGGIDEIYLEKVFEPYFTTKEESEGKGLGLYISKNIVEKRLDGSISVENWEGQETSTDDSGVCFTVCLSSKND